jgi:fluoride ion exporter CrcB/FEX
MTHFLHAYFWFMTAYLLVATLVMLFKWKRVVLLNKHKGILLENVVGCVLLVLGLMGVYGHLHAIPLVSAAFWQGFVVVLGLFSALQYFMTKIQLLRREKGLKVVVVAYTVGILMLAPMFGAVTMYGFMSPSLWVSF